MVEKWEDLGSTSNEQFQNEAEPVKNNVAYRSKFARAEFDKLTKEEKDEYSKRAKAKAEEEKKAYEEAIKNPPSKKPEDMQKYAGVSLRVVC